MSDCADCPEEPFPVKSKYVDMMVKAQRLCTDRLWDEGVDMIKLIMRHDQAEIQVSYKDPQVPLQVLDVSFRKDA